MVYLPLSDFDSDVFNLSPLSNPLIHFTTHVCFITSEFVLNLQYRLLHLTSRSASTVLLDIRLDIIYMNLESAPSRY